MFISHFYNGIYYYKDLFPEKIPVFTQIIMYVMIEAEEKKTWKWETK